MTIRQLLLSAGMVACTINGFAQKSKSIQSPDGNLEFNISADRSGLFYNISYKKKPLIQHAPIRIKFSDGDFFQGLHLKNAEIISGRDDYELVVGKTRSVQSEFRELKADVIAIQQRGHQIRLEARVYNDAVAFRYQFPKVPDMDSISIKAEYTGINFVGDPLVHALLLPNFTTSHEGFYSHLKLSEVRNDTLMDLPTLFEIPGKIYVAVTEAALRNYAGMYLIKRNGALQSQLSPLPRDPSISVRAALPHKSPWRVFLISDRIGSLLESNVITSLNDPPAIGDLSWIHPGKCTFPWWNGNVVPDSNFAPGNNFETNKYYIDFCARNKIDYHSVVEFGLHEWYTNDGYGFQPGQHVDVTKPLPGLDMKMICDYAKSQGVGIRVWIHWAALYPQLDSAFAIFERWGLQGMMVDFMDRDDQEMVNIQEEILQKAAKHHLHIQFHGAYKPTGLSRTYPNEFTREGTLNYETNKWNEQALPPDHDIIMPFTRMLAGPTDYHLGGFRAVTADKFKTQYTRPLMAGTRCHMLAMYVVLESYLGMVCDYPQAYEGQPGFEFIREVPTTWDETKVLDASVNEFITIARKKNGVWWVGSITNHETREINIPLNFLPEGEFIAEIFSDAADVATDPNHLKKETRNVNRTQTIRLRLAPGGGQAMKIFKP